MWSLECRVQCVQCGDGMYAVWSVECGTSSLGHDALATQNGTKDKRNTVPREAVQMRKTQIANKDDVEQEEAG